MAYNIKPTEVTAVYEQLFRDDNDRIEAQNIYQSTLDYLMHDLHFSFSKSVQMIHKLESMYDVHFYRQIELTDYLGEIQRFDPTVTTAHSNSYRHYLYQLKTGQPLTKYDGFTRSEIGRQLLERYGVKYGDRDYDKYYSILYRERAERINRRKETTNV